MYDENVHGKAPKPEINGAPNLNDSLNLLEDTVTSVQTEIFLLMEGLNAIMKPTPIASANEVPTGETTGSIVNVHVQNQIGRLNILRDQVREVRSGVDL